MLPQLLSRGTKNLSFQEYRDRLDELKRPFLLVEGSALSASASNRTRQPERGFGLLRQALREPLLTEKEFEVIQNQMTTQVESGLSEPTALAFTEFSRRLDPQPKDDVRYTPTIEENLEQIKTVNNQDVVSLYQDFLNGQHGEVAVVGDFGPDDTLKKLNEVFDGWKSEMPYQRIEEPANVTVKGERVNIDTPDKANAVYIAGVMTKMRDDDPDYEAMLIGNYIMGGGPLSSRIADRVRKQDGLSYTAATQFQADSEDQRGMYMMFCISNPQTRTKSVIPCVGIEHCECAAPCWSHCRNGTYRPIGAVSVFWRQFDGHE